MSSARAGFVKKLSESRVPKAARRRLAASLPAHVLASSAFHLPDAIRAHLIQGDETEDADGAGWDVRVLDRAGRRRADLAPLQF
jgi:hypothetical protein